MKKLKVMLGIFLCISALGLAQEKEEKSESGKEKTKVILKKDFEIEKHTIMERFETDFVVSADDRADLKRKRIADAEHTIRVLDTMDISDRKKRLILRDLKYNPFSERLSKFIAETKFEEQASNDNKK